MQTELRGTVTLTVQTDTDCQTEVDWRSCMTVSFSPGGGGTLDSRGLLIYEDRAPTVTDYDEGRIFSHLGIEAFDGRAGR